MSDISTTYMGLNLKSPLIAGSCGLTDNVDNLKRIEAAGAGAVVLKSLSEEEIIEEKIKTATSGFYSSFHTEAFEYISQMSMHFGPENYLKLIREAKSEISIPVIASVNCINNEYWVDFASKIEAAGADALELNISRVTVDPQESSENILQDYMEVVKAVKSAVKIPVAVKLGQNFTNISRFVKMIEFSKVQSIVLFNRFYQIDIDIDSETLTPGYSLSSPNDVTETLRWISLISGITKMTIAGSKGIHSTADVIKVLLAGASAAQVVSALYADGFDFIKRANEGLAEWMDKKNYNKISDFIGLLNQKNIPNPEFWEREQYIKARLNV